ncbi:MAG: DUF2336 domain-containing protein [Alphaproteobacteria bacterium]|nr:DUF2336 domain-containing protein [Alphaproteobacteria bacterium]
MSIEAKHGAEPHSGLSLNAADVDMLLAHPAAARRADLVKKVAAEFDAQRISEAESKIALDILRAMAADAEVIVRLAIAQSLRQSGNLPHDIALNLARDEFSVAQPLLESSPVLTDSDLIAILADGCEPKQVAIARRKDVSERVAAAVIDTGNAAAVATLIDNDSAHLTEDLYDRTLNWYSKFEAVNSALVHRAALPITVAERLVALVSDKLKVELVTRHALPEEMAADVILEARERVTLGLLGDDAPTPCTSALVRQLSARGRLTPSLTLRALCMGDIQFVEAALADAAGVTAETASSLVHDDGPLGLQAIYKKSGFAEAFFPAFRVAVDVYHETQLDGEPRDRERFARRMLERILTQYQDMTATDLDYLLTRLAKFEAA